MNKPPMILIAAGGTGGHIFPALALAEEYLRQGARVSWLGTGGMETDKTREKNLPLFVVPFAPPHGVRGWLALLPAVWRAAAVVRRLKPAAVLGMGGYASVPGALAARLCRVPLFIHEQNAVMGRANLMLAKYFADVVFTGFPNVFASGKWLGNPVRQDFVGNGNSNDSDSATDDVAANDNASPWRVLVLGGSQGAQFLNRTLPTALARVRGKILTVVHQCGRGNLAETQAVYKNNVSKNNSDDKNGNVKVTVREFIDDVAAQMRAADVVVCRAGASTMAELSAIGTAAILVPYPFAAANHQQHNAQLWADADAAVLCEEKILTPTVLAEKIAQMDKTRARQLAKNNSRFGKPQATADIVKFSLQWINHAA